MKKIITSKLILCVIVVFLLVSFSLYFFYYTGNKKQQDTIYYTTTQIYSLDPNYLRMPWDWHILGNFLLDDIMIGLFEEDSFGNPKLGLLKSYSVSNNNLVYTFYLKDTKWSDGSNLTAHDFVYSYQRILDPKNGSRNALQLYPIKNAFEYNKGLVGFSEVGIKLVNNYTFQITLAKPESFFISRLTRYAYFPVPKHTVEKYGKDWTKPENIVTNGAYKIVSYIPESIISLTKNSFFYDANNVAIEKVVYYIVSSVDKTINYNEFVSGKTDKAIFENTIIDKVRKKNHNNNLIYQVNKQSVNLLAVNVKNPSNNALKNPDIRKAIQLILSTNIVVNKQSGAVNMVNNFVPFGIANYEPVPAYWSSLLDQQKQEQALAIMHSLGYNDNNKLTLNYYHAIGDLQKQTSIFIANILKTINIELNIIPIELINYGTTVRALKHDLALITWSIDYDDPSSMFEVLQANGYNNYSGYNNPQVEILLNKASLEFNEKARYKIYNKIEEIVYTDLPYILYSNNFNYSIVNSRVGNFIPNHKNKNLTRWLFLHK